MASLSLELPAWQPLFSEPWAADSLACTELPDVDASSEGVGSLAKYQLPKISVSDTFSIDFEQNLCPLLVVETMHHTLESTESQNDIEDSTRSCSYMLPNFESSFSESFSESVEQELRDLAASEGYVSDVTELSEVESSSTLYLNIIKKAVAVDKLVAADPEPSHNNTIIHCGPIVEELDWFDQVVAVRYLFAETFEALDQLVNWYHPITAIRYLFDKDGSSISALDQVLEVFSDVHTFFDISSAVEESATEPNPDYLQDINPANDAETFTTTTPIHNTSFCPLSSPLSGERYYHNDSDIILPLTPTAATHTTLDDSESSILCAKQLQNDVPLSTNSDNGDESTAQEDDDDISYERFDESGKDHDQFDDDSTNEQEYDNHVTSDEEEDHLEKEYLVTAEIIRPCVPTPNSKPREMSVSETPIRPSVLLVDNESPDSAPLYAPPFPWSRSWLDQTIEHYTLEVEQLESCLDIDRSTQGTFFGATNRAQLIEDYSTAKHILYVIKDFDLEAAEEDRFLPVPTFFYHLHNLTRPGEQLHRVLCDMQTEEGNGHAHARSAEHPKVKYHSPTPSRFEIYVEHNSIGYNIPRRRKMQRSIDDELLVERAVINDKDFLLSGLNASVHMPLKVKAYRPIPSPLRNSFRFL